MAVFDSCHSTTLLGRFFASLSRSSVLIVCRPPSLPLQPRLGAVAEQRSAKIRLQKEQRLYALCTLWIWQLLTDTIVRHLAVIPSPRRSAFFTPTSALSLDQVLASPLRLDGEGFHHAASVPMKRPTIETRTHRLAKSESYAAQYVMSPVEMYCTGHCRETNQDPFTCISMPRAEVVSVPPLPLDELS